MSGLPVSTLLNRRKGLTAEELLAGSDLSGKTVVITGGNSGIGKETLRVLALAGARVIFTSRNLQMGNQVAAELSRDCLKGEVICTHVDLTNLHSVAQLAQQLQQEPCIDILILNAGVMGLPLGYTQHGFERHIGINHFGHFHLFQLLEDKLAAQSTETRVVVVTCGSHSIMDHRQGVNFADMHFTDGRHYGKLHAYGQSKSANILFAKQVATSWENVMQKLHVKRRHQGTNLKAIAVDPGAAKTGLQRHLAVTDMLRLRIANPIFRPIPLAAASVVWAALEPKLAGQSGAYIVNTCVSKPAKHCLDAKSAEKLWDASFVQVEIAVSKGRISMSPAENLFL